MYELSPLCQAKQEGRERTCTRNMWCSKSCLARWVNWLGCTHLKFQAEQVAAKTQIRVVLLQSYLYYCGCYSTSGTRRGNGYYIRLRSRWGRDSMAKVSACAQLQSCQIIVRLLMAWRFKLKKMAKSSVHRITSHGWKTLMCWDSRISKNIYMLRFKPFME